MKYFIVKEACVWQLQTCTWKVDCWNQRVSPYVELWVSHFFQKWLAKDIFHFSVKEKTKYCREMLDVPLGNVHLISLYEYPFQPFFSTCPRPWAAKPSFMGIIVSWAFLLIIYNYWHEIAFFFFCATSSGIWDLFKSYVSGSENSSANSFKTPDCSGYLFFLFIPGYLFFGTLRTKHGCWR